MSLKIYIWVKQKYSVIIFSIIINFKSRFKLECTEYTEWYNKDTVHQQIKYNLQSTNCNKKIHFPQISSWLYFHSILIFDCSINKTRDSGMKLLIFKNDSWLALSFTIASEFANIIFSARLTAAFETTKASLKLLQPEIVVPVLLEPTVCVILRPI